MHKTIKTLQNDEMLKKLASINRLNVQQMNDIIGLYMGAESRKLGR
jgi:hypothetical protein